MLSWLGRFFGGNGNIQDESGSGSVFSWGSENKEWKKQQEEEEKEPLRSPSDYPLKNIKQNRRYHIDLAPYLEKFEKKDKEVEGGDLYEVRFLTCLGYPEDHGSNEIFCDAKYTFVLVKRYKNSFQLKKWMDFAIALISFRVSNDKKSVKIVQIQGVQGKQKFFRALRWEKMLVHLVVDWARANGFKEVKIQRGEDNKWFKDGAIEKKETAILRYNVTAERCGFEYNKRKRIYFLNLKKYEKELKKKQEAEKNIIKTPG